MATRTPEIIAGRYALKRLHQQGGMATVYQARDIHNDELVAIKRFDQTKHLPEIEAEAYRREVEALRTLTHPNIVRILGDGIDERGRPYMVLEWMEFDLLEHRSRGASCFDGWDDFAEKILLPIVDALAYSHANGFCHRDVKPANVLLGQDGIPRLADFGISKLKRSLHPRLTLNEFMSRPYSPPEPDDGAFSYARDVFALGVLTVWALSQQSLQSYEDVDAAAELLDAEQTARDVIIRSLSRDPRKRQETAGVFANELARIQDKRREKWAEKHRNVCGLKLTRSATMRLMQDLALPNEAAVQRFVSDDVNESASVTRYVENYGQHNERVRPNEYSLLGGTLSYHVKCDDTQKFVVVNARQLAPDFVQRLKAEQLRCPIAFTFAPQTTINGIDARMVFELALAEFEECKREQREKTRQEQRFINWQNVLEAKSAYEREKVASLRFKKSSVRGPHLLILETESNDRHGVEIGQPRIIKSDGKWVSGEVYDFDDASITLYCHQLDAANVPGKGVVHLDTRAADIAIDRQRAALAQLKDGLGARADLRALLSAPDTAKAPDELTEREGPFFDGLDDSQADAVCAALATPDLLLVHGPPGTGKTRFIACLVAETLRRSPQARILLSSQTHVAIDNAIERITKLVPNIKIVRIARSGSDVVAETCLSFTVERQLDRWRQEVAGASEEWLRQWATRQGLQADEIVLGSQLKQIAAVRETIAVLLEEITEQDEALKEMQGKKNGKRDAEINSDIEAAEASLEELRLQLRDSRKHLESLEKNLRASHDDAKSFLELDGDSLKDWSATLLGKSEESRRAEQLLRLQADWLDRFGRDDSFYGALCERSSVVAATCIGLASLTGSDDVQYDLCIVDEASKATATEALVPMIRAKHWILVGDAKQLPPFEDEIHRSGQLRERFDIDSEEATETLFDLLRRELPQNCQRMLKKQYRMVPAIGRLISHCFYDAQLESNERPTQEHLVQAAGKAVTWLTTRYEPNRHEERAGSSFVNPNEVQHALRMARKLNAALIAAGRRAKVLFLSGYAAQVSLLRQSINREASALMNLDMECNTVDAVQGREADVVIFSVTRSNDQEKAGFLNELARINVALSRAQELLIIVGNDEFVRQAPNAEPLQRVLNYISENSEDCNLRWELLGS